MYDVSFPQTRKRLTLCNRSTHDLYWLNSFDNVFIYTLLIPFGKFGPPYLSKATLSSRKSSADPVGYKCMLGLFVFSLSTELCDMDYMIFNVRTYAIILMRAYTPGGGGAHQQRVNTTFLTRKNSTFSCTRSDEVRTSGLWIPSPTFYPLSHAVTPLLLFY